MKKWSALRISELVLGLVGFVLLERVALSVTSDQPEAWPSGIGAACCLLVAARAIWS